MAVSASISSRVFRKKQASSLTFKELRQYFDELSHKFRIVKQEDWYKKSSKDVIRSGGRNVLLQNFNESLATALKVVYPEFIWLRWRFATFACTWFNSTARKRQYFDWIGEQLCIETQSDWYNVRFDRVLKWRRKKVFTTTDEFVWGVIECYPEFKWYPWLFPHTPRFFWQDQNNDRLYFEWLKEQLGIEKKEDWYKVHLNDVKQRGAGRGLLIKYGFSLIKALQTVYPEEKFDPWLFEVSPRNYWTDTENVSKYINWLASRLNIAGSDDWSKRITKRQLFSFKGGGVLGRYGGMHRLLAQFNVQTEDLSSPVKTQYALFQVVSDIAQNEIPKWRLKQQEGQDECTVETIKET